MRSLRFLPIVALAHACGAERDVTGPTLTLAPPAGTYVGGISVILTASEPCTIRYTLDGSDPATSATAVVQAAPASVYVAPPSKASLVAACTDSLEKKGNPIAGEYLVLDALRPGSFSGTVRNAERLTGGNVGVALYDEDPTLNADRAPVGFANLGAPRADLPFAFEHLVDGDYWLAAGLWAGTPATTKATHFTPSSLGKVAISPDSDRLDFVEISLAAP